MIACVTFETYKVVNPILFYEINRAHIIHYVKDPGSESGRLYSSFYSRTLELIEEESPLPVEIVEHNENVSNFDTMLRTALRVIRSEKAADPNCDIYVNISSGTSEYAAASAIAAMMVPDTVVFSVGTREYTISGDRIRDAYFIDGKPVGLTKTTYDPRTLSSYSIQMPEEHLVRGLRVLSERIERNLSITSGKMIEALKENGIWYRDASPSAPDRKSSQRQTEAVYYQRDFINKWLRNGWIEKDELRNKYVLTDDGRSTIATFYTERWRASRRPVPHGDMDNIHYSYYKDNKLLLIY